MISINPAKTKDLPYHLMMLPGMILLFIYHFIPMGGIIIAFEKYKPVTGFFKSEWIGLDNFIYLFRTPDFFSVLWNTIYISTMKLTLNIIVPVVFALLLNEVNKSFFKRSFQTIIYFPHFLSWVLLGGIFIDIFSPSTGIVNNVLAAIGVEPVFFLGDNAWFPYILVITDVWKEFGWGTIIYLAAITGIDIALYEAAVVDGANKWKQVFYVTLPGMIPIIILTTVLSMGRVLNAGFDQIFNMYSPIVYESGDIIDTLVYRIGLVNAQYSIATAAGLFKSLISLLLIAVSYKAAYKLSGYKVF